LTCKKTILLASLMLIAIDVMIPSFAYDEIDMEKLKKLKMYSGYDKKGEWYQLYMIACERCDLTEAYLHGAKLSGAQLKSTSTLVRPHSLEPILVEPSLDLPT